MITQNDIEVLKQQQFRWDIHFKNRPVKEMMNLHRFIEVAEEAPEYVESK